MSRRREDNEQSMEPSGNEQERAALVEEPPSGGGPSQFRVSIPHDSHRTPAAVQEAPFSLLRLRLEGENVWSVYPERTTTQQNPVTQPSSGTVGSSSPYSVDRIRRNTYTERKTFMEQLIHKQPIPPSPSVGTERRRDRTTEDSEPPRESPARKLHRSADGQHRQESQPRTDPQLRVRGRFRVVRVEESQEPLSRWTSVKNFFSARIPPRLRGVQCFFLMMSVFICILAALLSWLILYVSSHYTGWYCKIEVFYHTLSPNRSVEQILAVERN